MRLKTMFACLFIIAMLGVGTAGAQYDCSNLAPSAGPAPQELFDHCSVGPGPVIGADFPSDFAFGPETQTAMFVSTMLSAPDVLNTIAPFDITNFTGACEFADPDFSTLYCADSANMFFSIDTATGARTDIGPLTPPPPGIEAPSGLAFDGSSMFLTTTDVATSSLMTVHISGVTTYKGPITGAPGLIAAAWDSTTGGLFGYGLVTDSLFSIDTTTGAGTLVGPLGFDANFGQGMDCDHSDGTCYLFAFNGVSFLPELWTFDPTTFATAFVGVIGSTTPGGLLQIPGAGIAAAPPSGSTLFASDDDTNGLYVIDPATGASTPIGPAGEDLSYSGLAWDSWRNVMYVSDVSLGGSGWGLGRIDIYTGAVTIIGSHVNTSGVTGLAFDSINNVLYGGDANGGCLVTVDRATGEASPCIGGVGAAPELYGMAHNNHTDTLFGVTSSDLVTIDRVTGGSTPVGPHGITFGFGTIGLEYDSETGVLYAAGSGDPNLYSLNLATGAASPIGPHGLAGLSGLASITAPGEPCGVFCDGFESGDTSAWQ